MAVLNKDELISLVSEFQEFVRQKKLPDDLINLSFKKDYLSNDILDLVGDTPEEVTSVNGSFGVHSCNGGYICIGNCPE